MAAGCDVRRPEQPQEDTLRRSRNTAREIIPFVWHVMDEALIGEVLKYAGATGIGGVAMAFVLRFAWRKLVEEGAAAQRAVWETEFIAMLRAEIERLARLNRELYEQAAELHTRVIRLTAENARLEAQIAQRLAQDVPQPLEARHV